MRASLQVLLALGTAASATEVLRPVAGVYRRQAFDPDEETLPAEDCSDFGPTYVECRAESASRPRLCIDPSVGETCCDNQWGCPADSFCLVAELCCPNGLDPEICAERNNVELPPDFGTNPPSTDIPTGEPEETPSPTDEPEEPEESSEDEEPEETDEPEPEEPEESEAPTDDDDASPPAETSPPVEAGASVQSKAGVLGALVGLVAFVL